MKLGDYEFGTVTNYSFIRSHIHCPGNKWDVSYYESIGKILMKEMVQKEVWNRSMISKRINYINKTMFGIESSGGRVLIISIGSVKPSSEIDPMYLVQHYVQKQTSREFYFFMPSESVRENYIKNAPGFNKGFFHYTDTLLIPVIVRQSDDILGLVAPPPQILANYGKHEKIKKIDILSGLQGIKSL
jgi:hypothetical protein